MQDIIEKNRGDFKKIFFRDIWFSKPRKNWTPPAFKSFRKQFPSVAAAIIKIKEKDYTKFPVDLQKLEAKAMLDTIGKKLRAAKVKFLTIHDSIVINSLNDLKYAESLIAEFFQSKYGVKPAFKNDYNEILDTKKLSYRERFKPTYLFMYNEMEYQLNKKIGHLASA